ncbi:DUF6452 family protein [Rurimicrobium arvi]|uniref:Lipoprotein n=1 Tax=Rurimicrobium arvi TaxID=2049916 RepID=A0ABP8MK85_9BACT
MVNKQAHKPAVTTAGICLFAFLAACNSADNPCLVPTLSTVAVHCSRFDATSNTYADTALQNANFVCLDIDSARYWYYGAKGLSNFSIVLAPLKDTVRWTLQVDSGYSMTDTLFFIYESKLTFYSNACGYAYTYHLKQLPYTRHNLDSVAIINPEITTKANVQNVGIFF